MLCNARKPFRTLRLFAKRDDDDWPQIQIAVAYPTPVDKNRMILFRHRFDLAWREVQTVHVPLDEEEEENSGFLKGRMVSRCARRWRLCCFLFFIWASKRRVTQYATEVSKLSSDILVGHWTGYEARAAFLLSLLGIQCPVAALDVRGGCGAHNLRTCEVLMLPRASTDSAEAFGPP